MKRSIATAAVAILGLLGATGIAMGAEKVKTTIDDVNLTGPPNQKFTGVLAADEGACRKGRDVTVTYAGEVVDGDTTDKKGKFVLEVGTPQVGNYTIATKKKSTSKFTCSAAKYDYPFGDF
jgi:hypothetical protein